MAQALSNKPILQHSATGQADGLLADLRPKILVVDDRKENLLATEKVLRNLDVTIFKAISGNEALSLMLRHQFAVILLDVQMPEMDGFETAKLMQEQEQMRGTPIIFVTAINKDEKYASQAAEIGAVDYIFKPINPDILRSKVKVYIDIYVQREQILKLNSELRQSNEELERFAYICSHDMQEPVRMMESYAEMMEQTCLANLDDRGKKYLGFILSNARHLRKMIRDILTFSRIGREEIKFEKVDCNQVMKEVLGEFESIIESKKADIRLGSLPALQTSQTLVRVLFQNLIGNALKFQARDHTPEIRIEAQLATDTWEFRISDNGIGIDPNFNSRVFTIFQRIHRKEDFPGTGIGLSTCKKFIELCGGTIRFQSSPGQGTTFFFTLPTEEVSHG
ncbi:MAG: hybrid sensor histidine kinase/response regulator [Alphaproteobacteria bacterium]|nr:MAG: hybrid sensor histidine kinase/response regulator [Alphaproteobacteria bacterium]